LTEVLVTCVPISSIGGINSDHYSDSTIDQEEQYFNERPADNKDYRYKTLDHNERFGQRRPLDYHRNYQRSKAQNVINNEKNSGLFNFLKLINGTDTQEEVKPHSISVYYTSGSRGKSKTKSIFSPSFSSNSQLTDIVHFKRGRSLDSGIDSAGVSVKCYDPQPQKRGYQKCFAQRCALIDPEPSPVISAWISSLIGQSGS